MRAERVIDRNAGHPEITVDFVCRGHGVNHAHRLCMAQPLVVEKEETTLTSDRTAERGPEIISHQMTRGVHVIEIACVENVVAQKLVRCSMKFVRAGARCDVDLAAAGAAHLGGVTSGHHLKFLHGVRRRAQVQSVECRIGIRCPIQQEVVCIRPIAANAHG